MKKLILIAFITGSGAANAQQGVHTAGGNASGTGGSVSYSVGQVFYSSQSGTSGALIQGVQHPFELLVTEIKAPASSSIKCEAFPNPAVKELNLRISGELSGKGSWRLIDSKGVTVMNGEISNSETLIPMAAVPMASYTLQVYSGKKELNTFKIIKQ